MEYCILPPRKQLSGSANFIFVTIPRHFSNVLDNEVVK